MSSEKDSEVEANVPVWIQFILSATIVTTITYLAHNVSYKYASILYSLPYTFLILLTIYSYNNFPKKKIRKFAFNVILSLFNISLYSFAFTMLEKYTNLSVTSSLILSFVPWAMFAMVMYHEPYKKHVDKYILS